MRFLDIHNPVAELGEAGLVWRSRPASAVGVEDPVLYRGLDLVPEGSGVWVMRYRRTCAPVAGDPVIKTRASRIQGVAQGRWDPPLGRGVLDLGGQGCGSSGILWFPY